jgi:oxepin-CoA hydrolase/3-oxo-5,6-dehydrosuberyl-CoA semialdehyde dehydrogenase
MTFHERAELLKAVGQLLRDNREELYQLSYRTGATLADSRFDIDGGIGVLLSYASKAKRELPNENVVVEGLPEQLGKRGHFLGQHLLTARHGVAVQVNAYNFPVWGPLEKLAPAFIAGVPTLIKPASQTGYLTVRAVELIIESGLLPEGALQLVSGSAGDLLDHLREQDLLSFTGSASTARRLRAHPNVVASSVRFNAEADSLNMSVLGPDGVPGTPAFDRYVAQLVTEMTVKAGQKCTAIRRAFVPEAQLDAVTEAVRERLAGIVIGHPADRSVRMGALASLEQREEVRRSLKALEAAGRVVFGDPEHVEVAGADDRHGAFLSPVLVRADDARRAEVHEVEAFGPVATLIGYRDTADVVDLASLGKGSLAGSVVTDDPEFARSVVLGTAPWHGRLLVLDAVAEPEFTGDTFYAHTRPGDYGEVRWDAEITNQDDAVVATYDVLTMVSKEWSE